MKVGRIWRTSKRSNERGAVLVETAIFITLIAVMLNAVLDYGVLFGDDNDLSGAVRAAAIASGSTGVAVVNDNQILSALISQSGTKYRDIQRVVIYEAASGAQGPPTPCKTMTAAMVPTSGQKCNVYFPSDFTKTEAQLEAESNSKGWPVAARQAGSDFAGIWVEAKRTPFMNLVWSPTSYSDNFIARIEPIVNPPQENTTIVNPSAATPPSDDASGCWGSVQSPGGDGTCLDAAQPDPSPGGSHHPPPGGGGNGPPTPIVGAS